MMVANNLKIKTMKHILLITALLVFTLSCKAQTVITLGDNGDFSTSEKPRFIKDLNNLRDNFYGVWQGSSGISELTLYIYKIDDIPIGLSGKMGKQFNDIIFGYYIYKENGVELINSLTEAQNNNQQLTVQYAPFYGPPKDGEKINSMFFKDYGVQIENEDGSFGAKSGKATFNITNLNSGNALEANFELKNRAHIMKAYNYSFSMPTNFTLTKIANTPPPLN